MDTAKLKKFAQFARRSLIEQVSGKLKLVLVENSAARRESTEAIKKLDEAIKSHGKEQVIERVAYIWFNRFCALRFMDVNRYTRIGVVSPAEGQFQPEILAEAKMGHIDEEMVHDKVRQQIFALLDGKSPSRDPQGEAYRLLVVATCNFWNKAMPFLFQRIDDYTELLMPDDLLSGNSILAYTREAMTPDAWEDVEVIGWLYQFYISEKKDEVFDGLKKNKKITPENIPAATQLFTPHWIVRYLMENSLGRLWLLNRPGSKLAEQMDYYIKPEQAETDFLRIAKPEEIKICDPACGSGHMLTYAFDLLYAIYEEEGYASSEIPEKILTHNLHGIEIDERAGELAAFALTMKARAKQRRFFNKSIKPNICVLENVHFDEGELKNYMDFVGRDLFTAPLQTTLRQFEEADNFGSLIRPNVTDVDGMLKILESKNVSGQLLLHEPHKKVMQALRQADYLSSKYHVVIANPPYMGGKGMNGRLGAWLKNTYANLKSDLFSAFIGRNIELALPKGQLGFMTPFVWMFIGNFEKLRNDILKNYHLTTLVRPEYHSFFESAFVPICAFVIDKKPAPENTPSTFIDLQEFYGADLQPIRLLEAIKDKSSGWRHDLLQSLFLKIPGSPISFGLPSQLVEAFSIMPKNSGVSSAKKGITTGNNGKYLRLVWELNRSSIGFSGKSPQVKFYPHAKGGDARRWFGNGEFAIAYDETAIENMENENGFRHDGKDFFFREGITWSGISSDVTAFRYLPPRQTFNNAAPTAFFEKKDLQAFCLLAMNSKVARPLIQTLNPTMNFNPGDFGNLPIPVASAISSRDVNLASSLIALSKCDWDFYETSWDFTRMPLLNPDYLQPTLKATYQKVRANWREMTLEMQRLEEENNRIFIEAYGLHDELTPEVPLNEITLTCNPQYRYDNDKSEDELEALLLADTMRDLVSYAVGCMFGRYALDKPGLILANQGETIEDYLKQVPEPSFPADDDNVIPMLDGDWFTDDIAERFRKFLRVAFGEEHYEENLKFVEKALGKDLRKYFLKDFYNDHVRRYKKRPIYWLFSSPKGSFNALIYLHRYRPDTASVVLNGYLREFRTKLTSRRENLEQVGISTSASPGEKTKAIKEIEQLKKMIAELEDYEREVLYPLASEQVEIDLNDGVKTNYPKLGAALKKIVGLDATNE